MPTRQELVYKRLIEEGDKMLTALDALLPEQRTRTVYTDGAAWTVKDILAHQLSTERAIRVLVNDILGGGGGSPEGFSIDGFNTTEVAKMTAMSWEELVKAFRAARADTADAAAHLTDEQLDRRGRHPFLGVTSVEDILQMLYRHNMMHVRDIRRALAG
jgi:uncharacterized protein (TIGR03083 family)